MRLLVVLLEHADAERRGHLASVLREWGFAVAEAQEAPEGLRPDVVVADDAEDGAVRAALERHRGARPPLALGPVSVDWRTGTVFGEGDAVPLTEREGALLAWLVARAGHTVSRAELLVHVWGYRAQMVTRTVDVTIGRLREKIEVDPSAPAFLQTVRGHGYLLTLPDTAPAPAPAPSDAVVGRQADLAALEEKLGTARVVTLLGPPGIGKTTLGRALAQARGGLFVPLETATTEEAVSRSVAEALLLPASARPEAIGNALAARSDPVLVLDNVEQVVDATADLVAQWRVLAPEARFVLTSRRRLRLDEEDVLDLGPLSPGDAVALLLARARKRRPGWGEGEDEAVAGVAEALDGVPLALELAAARARLLAPAALLDRLRSSLDLLRDDRRGRSDRQLTLAGAVQWSWDLLDETERAALAQLATFREGFTLEAAEAVLDLPDGDPLFAVEALVDHSLVQERDGGTRFALLPWIRDYAARTLSPEARGAAADRHAAWFARWGAALRAQADGSDGWDAIAAMRTDRANLQAAAEHLLAAGEESGATLVAALFPYWELQGIPRDAVDLLRRARAVAADPGPRGEVGWVGALVLAEHGELEEAEAWAREALSIAVDDRARFRARYALGFLAMRRNDWGVAEDAFTTALEGGTDKVADRVRALGELGVLLRRKGSVDRALAYLQEGVALAEAHALDPVGTGVRGLYASALLVQRRHEESLVECRALREVHRAHGSSMASVFASLVGVNLYLCGRFAEALDGLTEAIGLASEYGLIGLVGQTQLHRARVLFHLGRFEEGAAQARDAIATDRRARYRLEEAIATVTLADCLRELGDLASAVDVGEQADALSAEVGVDRGRVQAAVGLALTHLSAGRLEASRVAAQRVLGADLPDAPPDRIARLRGWLAWMALREGGAAEALEAVDAALGDLPTSPDTSVEGALRCVRAAARYALQDAAFAEDLDAARDLLAPGWEPAASEALACYERLRTPSHPFAPRFSEAALAAALVDALLQ